MTIDELRKKVDKIDIDLVHLLAMRMELSVDIGREKKINKEAVQQATRESVVLDKVKLLGDTLGLDENFISNLYNVILTESRRIQGELK